MKRFIASVIGLAVIVCGLISFVLPTSVGLPILPDTIEATQPGTTLLIIQDAVNSKGGAFVMWDAARNYIFAKPFSSGFWGFVLSGKNTTTTFSAIMKGYIGGNAANKEAFNSFIRFAEEKGFQRVDPSQLPWKVTAIGGIVHSIWASSAAFVSTSESFFITVPLSAFDTYYDLEVEN